MAHTQVAGEVHVLAQGQHTASAQHPPMAHDHRAVMHGGLDEENVFQQLGGHCRVQHRAAADHIVQQNLPLKDDEGAGAALGHFCACQHRLSDGLFHRAGGFLMDEEGHQTAAAHLLQYPADLRLKQNDEGQQAQIDHAGHDVIDPVQMQGRGQHQRRQKDQQSLYQTGRLGALYQCENFIEDKCHDGNIQYI